MAPKLDAKFTAMELFNFSLSGLSHATSLRAAKTGLLTLTKRESNGLILFTVEWKIETSTGPNFSRSV